MPGTALCKSMRLCARHLPYDISELLFALRVLDVNYSPLHGLSQNGLAGIECLHTAMQVAFVRTRNAADVVLTRRGVLCRDANDRKFVWQS